MAIPIFNNGETIKTAAPQRTTLMPALRGVSVDARTLMGAVETPRLDASGAIAEGRAGAAIGAAVSGVGDVMGKMAQQQMHSVNLYKVAQANAAMVESQAELDGKIAQEKDETKWAGMAEEHYAGVKGTLLTDDLSPVAREQIELSHMRWSAGAVGQIRVASFKESNKKAGEHLLAGYHTAIANKDTPLAEKLAQQLGSGGFVGEDVATGLKIDAANKVKRVQKTEDAEVAETTSNTIQEAAYNHPEDTARDLMMQDGAGNYLWEPKMTFDQRAKLVLYAEQRSRTMERDEYEQIGDLIAKGKLKTVEKLGTLVSPRMSPTSIAELEQDILKRQDLSHKEVLKRSIPENAMALWREARDYKPTGDEDEDEWAGVQFRRKVKTLLPEGEQEDALARWKRTVNPRDIPIDADLNQQASNYATSVMASGAWGTWESVAVDANGKWIFDPVTGKVKMNIDRIALNKADAMRTDLKQHLQDYLKKTPKATATDLLAEGRRLIGGAAAAQAAPILIDAPDPLTPMDEYLPEDGVIEDSLFHKLPKY